MMSTSTRPGSTDVLVIGGGPAGSAVGSWLAAAGHAVTIVEKRAETRHKSCGDTLMPRAVAELGRLDELAHDGPALTGSVLTRDAHRIAGVRMVYGSAGHELAWPAHPDLPPFGLMLRRDILDQRLRNHAAELGAQVLMGHEAVSPIAERGFVRGATLLTPAGETRDIRARFIVVADGASSRFGRGLGTSRQRAWPYAIAARTYFRSPRSAEAWIESSIGLPDADGNPIAGYGWVSPMGDGHLNVGIGVLSTFRDIKALNTLKLLASFSERMAATWSFDAAEPLKPATRLRIPLGGSVGPVMGPTFLVVGDAGGAANPFSGAGIDAALTGARLASEVIDEALTTGNSTSLQRFPAVLAEEFGQYRKVGRLTARFLGRPAVLRSTLQLAARSESVRGSILRIATNELRHDDSAGGAERAYKAASVIAKFAPSW